MIADGNNRPPCEATHHRQRTMTLPLATFRSRHPASEQKGTEMKDGSPRPYTSNATSPANSKGVKARYDVDGRDGAAAERLVVAKTISKLRLDELKQFDSLTSATSRGSAKVISTHYNPTVSMLVPCVYGS